MALSFKKWLDENSSLMMGGPSGAETAKAMGRAKHFETATSYDLSMDNPKRLSHMQKAIKSILDNNTPIENNLIVKHIHSELGFRVKAIHHLFATVTLEENAVKLQYRETAGKPWPAMLIWSIGNFVDPRKWRFLRAFAMKTGLWQKIEDNLIDEIKTQLAGAEQRGFVKDNSYHENEWHITSEVIGRDIIITPKKVESAIAQQRIKSEESPLKIHSEKPEPDEKLPMAAHNLNL